MRLNRARYRIESVMAGQDSGSNLARLLMKVSLLYGRTMSLRNQLYKAGIFKSRKLPAFVISVGNIIMGGTGKTPMTIHLARKVRDMGLCVAVLCRGYKGKFEYTGGVVSDGNRIFMGPEEAGDEPYLLASKLEKIPVLVGKSRYRTGLRAMETFSPQVIILDDAFQHRAVKRDLDLVLLDSRAPFGNDFVFPAGVLREPKEHLVRAHAFILTRCDPLGKNQPELTRIIEKLPPGKPVFKCAHRFQSMVSSIGGGGLERFSIEKPPAGTCIAFSGIARNRGFKKMLRDAQFPVVRFLSFPDHYHYTTRDIDKIVQTAQSHEARYIVTTEKDLVKVKRLMPGNWPLYALELSIDFKKDRHRFEAFLKKALVKINHNQES